MTTIVLLALTGIILICLETVLPGMILGILGIIATLTSLILVFTTDNLPSVFAGGSGKLLLFSTILTASAVVICYWLKHFDKLPFGKSLILDTSIDGTIDTKKNNELVGMEGTAVTDLNPVGKVDIKKISDSCEFVAENGFIKSGTKIKIIKFKNNQIIVRKH